MAAVRLIVDDPDMCWKGYTARHRLDNLLVASNENGSMILWILKIAHSSVV